MEPHSLKLTIKLKSENSVGNSLASTGNLSNVKESSVPQRFVIQAFWPSFLKIMLNFSAGGVENHTRHNEENPSENSQCQLVLYDPNGNGSGEAENPNPNHDQPQPPRQHQRSVQPSVGAFTVQCAKCFKWRVIPTQEKYEEIREHIIEQPFICEAGKEWRPDISCDDPPDLEQDGSRLWAIDKPSIAQPPPGWQRLLKFRGEGSSKFADVYYVAPSGKRLRSMVEIQRYLDEHPEYKEQGVSLSRFSFQIPRPLQVNYVRKRPARAAPISDADDLGMQRFPHPSEAEPISWVGPDVDTDLQLSRPGHSTDYSNSAKKRKTPAKTRVNGD